MEQMNRIELRGYVGAVNRTETGDVAMLRFSLVTGYAYKASDGTAVIENTWFDCLLFRSPGSLKDLPSLGKGDRVHLTGRLREQRYTGSDGMCHCTYAVLVKDLTKYDGETPLTYELDNQ